MDCKIVHLWQTWHVGVHACSAGPHEARTQAGVKRKYDLCITAANVEHSPDGMPVATKLQTEWVTGPGVGTKRTCAEVDRLFTTMSKLAPALTIGRNYGDKAGSC